MPPTTPWGKKPPPQTIPPSPALPRASSDKKGDPPQRTQYEEIQEEELFALAAIYGDDFRKIESHQGAWKVCTSKPILSDIRTEFYIESRAEL